MKKWISLLLLVFIVAGIGISIYIFTNPGPGERLTEFYLLGPEGRPENYPANLELGEEAQVILTIVNREQEPESYSVQIMLDGSVLQEIGPIALENEEKWQELIRIRPESAGPNQRLEFALYKLNPGERTQTLFLTLNVTG